MGKKPSSRRARRRKESKPSDGQQRPRSRKTLLGVTLVAIFVLVVAGLYVLQRKSPKPDPTSGPARSPASSPAAAVPANVDTASFHANQDATELNRSGRYVEALQRLDDAIARDSTYDQLFVTRGMAYRGLRQFERAVDAFGRAIALAPGASRAYLYRGIVYTDDLGLYDLGIQDFRRVIELDPGSTDAMMNIGVALYKAGRYDEAIQQYNSVIPMIPSNGRAVYLRGLAFRAKGEAGNAYADMLNARGLGVRIDQALLDSLRLASDAGG